MQKINPHVYRHISYLDAGNFGKVACNGLVVLDQGEAVVFDTPAEEADGIKLISWIKILFIVKLKRLFLLIFMMIVWEA